MSDEMRREIDGLKTEMAETKVVVRRLAIQMTKLTSEISEFKTQVKSDLAVLLDTINRRFDGMAAILEDTRYRHAVHADTLLQHDLRLKKLESRGS